MAVKLHLFNPENDLALAANLDHYTPPKAAVDLRRSGALLPMWYADAGDRVLCHGVNARWFDSVRTAFGIDVDVFDHEPSSAYELRPWGWSRAARTDFLNEGFDSSMLPDDAALDRLRMLSHRRTAAEIGAEVASAVGSERVAFSAREMREIDEVESALNRGEIYVKAPWSSSGRGVLSSAEAGRERTLRRASEIIASQGSVMVEDAFDKNMDFARIYECSGGKCRALSTSVFITDGRGAYAGNVLADEQERRSRVEDYVDAKLFDACDEAVRHAVEERIAPYYNGIVGVDMMASDDGRIMPVVEINLRATMGYAANRFADRYLAPGATGVFSVSPRQGAAAPDEYKTESGRLCSGRLSLVPPGAPFMISAAID